MHRWSTMVLLAAIASGMGCAHGSAARDTVASPATDEEAEAGVDAPILQMRRETEALRRRVQMLEDRLLRLEQGGAAAEAPPRAPASEPSLPPPRRSRSLAEAGPPRARSIVLEVPAPDPSEAQDLAWDDDPVGLAQAAPAEPAPEPDPGGGSYRLVGSRLVELTQEHGPPRPDRPEAGAKGRSRTEQYEAAMQLYRAGAFARAEAAFEVFARAHAESDYADNALYWKGESAYDQGHFADALAAFTEVVERYGGGNKAPDALLKIGLCYDKLGDSANAHDVLSQLVAAYPGARASDIARARLAELEANT